MYLTPGDIAAFEVPGAPSTSVIQKWISKAETSLARKLRQRGVSLATLATDPQRLPDIIDILENAVLRVLRNPDGAKSESEGDYSITLNPLDSSGNVWFPAADLDDLCPAPSSRIRTVSLGLTDVMAPPRHRDDACVFPVRLL